MVSRGITFVTQHSWAVALFVLLVGSAIYLVVEREPERIEYTVQSGPFVRTVAVSGTATPAQEVSLAFALGGRIERIDARVGATVQNGSVLGTLERDESRALLAQRQAALDAEAATLRSLELGTRSEEIALAESKAAAARVSEEQALQALIEELRDAYRAADDAVRVKADSFIDQPRTQPQLSFITSDTVTKAAVENTRASLEDMLEAWEAKTFSLSVANVFSVYAEAQAHLSRISSFLVDARTVIVRGVITGNVTEDTLETYAANVASARSSVNSASAALTTADTARKAAEAAREQADQNLALLRAGPTTTTLETQRAKVALARAALLDAEAHMRKGIIVAPFAGVVTAVEGKKGETVNAQEPIVTIISADPLLLESYVPEIYIGDIALDDSAEVIFDAYGDAGAVKARVVSIDPAETIRDGVATYKTTFALVAENVRIKPGMTASIAIETDARENVIAIPEGFVSSDASGAFVRVRTGENIVERRVSVGQRSSAGLIEIISGLSSGEVVVE